MFDRMVGFKYATNCYIPSRQYLPRGYGQLGCSGFVVADGRGNFISRKTRAFLEYGEGAFRHVESILAEELKVSHGPKVSKEVSAGSAPSCISMEGRGEDIKASVSVPSIGIASMDDEHDRCARALEDLLEKLSIEALSTAIDEIQRHFRHEEDLLIRYKFGGSVSDPFSALHSHFQDHRTIVKLGTDQLRQSKARADPQQTSCDVGQS